MKKIYGITKYPYSHSMFHTDSYYEVYEIQEDAKPTDGGKAIALFGDEAEARNFLVRKEKE